MDPLNAGSWLLLLKLFQLLDNLHNSCTVQHFYAEPRAAKDILGWQGTTNLPEDLKERFDEYVKIGRDKKPITFEIDDKILESLKVPVAVWSIKLHLYLPTYKAIYGMPFFLSLRIPVVCQESMYSIII